MKHTPNQFTLDQCSHFISGNHPTRALSAEDRADYVRPPFVLGYQRGFEMLYVAVYGEGINSADAHEAAMEYLVESYPDSVSDADEEGPTVAWIL